MNAFPILSILTGVPLVGALIVATLRQRQTLARPLALGFNLGTLLLSVLLWRQFDAHLTGLQFDERHDWIPSLGVQYFLGLDGLGLLMVLLSALVVPFALLASSDIRERQHSYYALMLLLQAGLFGAFTALNFFHWFIYWELILFPAYFLIKQWGGPGRTKAATLFFIYTLVGSVAMLLGFVGIYLATGSFDFMRLPEMRMFLSNKWSWVMCAGILFGFAVKVPMMPFHSWLPAAYAEAPTGVTMVLTGAMSKMGLYGFLRILIPVFPDQMRYFHTPLLWLTVGTILLSAWAALAQKDLKRLLAYSSINHLGYCLLGIYATVRLTGGDPRWMIEKSAALNGVFLQMFNHGITASALFCFVGFLERRSGGSRRLDGFGGLRQAAPVFCGLMGIAMFASLGLPGLNGFTGEFLIFKGAFPLASWAASLSVLGLLLTAVFLLGILQRVFSGPLAPQWNGFADLTARERWSVAPALGLMLFIGLYPQIILEFTNPAVMRILASISF